MNEFSNNRTVDVLFPGWQPPYLKYYLSRVLECLIKVRPPNYIKTDKI